MIDGLRRKEIDEIKLYVECASHPALGTVNQESSTDQSSSKKRVERVDKHVALQALINKCNSISNEMFANIRDKFEASQYKTMSYSKYEETVIRWLGFTDFVDLSSHFLKALDQKVKKSRLKLRQQARLSIQA